MDVTVHILRVLQWRHVQYSQAHIKSLYCTLILLMCYFDHNIRNFWSIARSLNVKDVTITYPDTKKYQKKGHTHCSYVDSLNIKTDIFFGDIVSYSVEVPTRCSFVIEFIISKFVKGSTCFERHTAHYQEL